MNCGREKRMFDIPIFIVENMLLLTSFEKKYIAVSYLYIFLLLKVIIAFEKNYHPSFKLKWLILQYPDMVKANRTLT